MIKKRSNAKVMCLENDQRQKYDDQKRIIGKGTVVRKRSNARDMIIRRRSKAETM
jgi:hypothetical protein